jgi:teichuronic acid biosynthesis protein TuaE
VIIAVSSLILLIETNSRANVLGFILGLLFLIGLLFQKISFKKRVLIITSMLTGLFVCEAVTRFFSSVWVRYFNSMSIGTETVRVNLLKNGLEFIKKTLGFGVGAGNIEYWMENYSIYDTRGVLNIHNWWGELLTAYGIYFTILYLAFYIWLFVTLNSRYKTTKNRDSKILALGFMGILVMFIVSSVSSSSNIIRDWLWIFWGIMIAFQGLEKDSILKKTSRNFTSEKS